jgi:hypothetical protein
MAALLCAGTADREPQPYDRPLLALPDVEGDFISFVWSDRTTADL